MIALVGVGLIGASVVVICAQPQTAQGTPALPPTNELTFTADVAPIVFNHCTACHRPGEAAPFALMSYEDVRLRGRSIAAVVRSRQMPPWKTGAGDYSYHGDRRLTEAQIATMDRWVAAGMPEGDRSKLQKLPAFTAGWQLGQPDVVVTMPEAFPVPARGSDVYRNFAIPLNLKEDKWVTAFDFRPSARTVVHHSLFFFDTTGTARQKDESDPEPGYSGGMGGLGGRRGLAALLGGSGAGRGRDRANASGGAAARTSGGLGGWTPGGQSHPLPDGLAFFLPKGSDLILSTHFHPSGTAERETSTVGLYFSKAPPTRPFTAVQLSPMFGVFEGIDIAPGQSTYTIADSFVLPIDVKAFGVGGHAHYLAKEMMLTATLPNGAVKTLLSIPDWDFSWQEQYQFEGYVDLPAGTKLDVTIRYDNSAANRRNPSSPPKRVTWGEQSTDEMGSMSLQVVAARPGDLPRLQQAYNAHVSDRLASRAPFLGAILQRRAGGQGR